MTLKEKIKLKSTTTAIKGALKIMPKLSDEQWLKVIRGRIYKLKKKEERDFMENLFINIKRKTFYPF